MAAVVPCMVYNTRCGVSISAIHDTSKYINANKSLLQLDIQSLIYCSDHSCSCSDHRDPTGHYYNTECFAGTEEEETTTHSAV